MSKHFRFWNINFSWNSVKLRCSRRSSRLPVSPHIFHKRNCCHLNLGESLCIFTFFLFSLSGLYLWKALVFILTCSEWSETENQQLTTSCVVVSRNIDRIKKGVKRWSREWLRNSKQQRTNQGTKERTSGQKIAGMNERMNERNSLAFFFSLFDSPVSHSLKNIEICDQVFLFLWQLYIFLFGGFLLFMRVKTIIKTKWFMSK